MKWFEIRKVVAVLGLCLLLASLCSSVSAQTIWSDDFESYEAGSALTGQGGWRNWFNNAGITGTVSDQYAFNGRKSLKLGPATDTVQAWDLRGGRYILTVRQYIPSGSSGTSVFALCSRYVVGSQEMNLLTRYQLSSGTITSDRAGLTSIKIIYDEWVEISVIVDLDTRIVEEYYDGELIFRGTWSSNNTWQNVNLWSVAGGTSPIYYDDFRLTWYVEPNPADRAVEVASATQLSWWASDAPLRYDVYFGTSYEDVKAATVTDPRGVLVSIGQKAPRFDPGRLEIDQTYYWRVDRIGGALGDATHTGRVWQFTTEPYSYPVANITATASSAQGGMGPEKTVDGSGLDRTDGHSTDPKAMWLSMMGVVPHWIQYEFDKVYTLHELWVWNSNQMVEPFMGFGARTVKIEYSADGTTWTPLAGVPEFAQATGKAGYKHNTTISFGGVPAKFVKLMIEKGWGTTPMAGLGEVRFYYLPVRARGPIPADGAADVAIDANLSWRPGREAATHQVYFSTDREAVADGTAAALSLTDNRFEPAALELATSYFWRVDAVGATGVWKGDVWSFTTKGHAIVDNFESYTDAEGNRIYESWIDGEANGTGSVVGHPQAPFAERIIVHGGRQSMPLEYDNTKAPFYSEAELTFANPQDWTASGVKSLSLWFLGAAGNGGQLYVKINDTKVLYDGEAADLAQAGWQVWNIDLSQAGPVNQVRSLTIGIEGAGTKGRLYIDEIRLYPKEPQYMTPVAPAATNLVAHYTFDEGTGSRAGDSSGNNIHGTLVGGYRWVSGIIGGAVELTGNGYVVMNGVAQHIKSNVVTLSAWIKTTRISSSHGCIFAPNDNTGGYSLQVTLRNGSISICDVIIRTDYPPSVADDEWHHIAFILDGGTAYIYVDGLPRATWTTTMHFGAMTRWSIGQEWDGQTASDFYTGLVDDARVYSRPLSAAEVAGLAGMTKPRHAPF